MFNQIGGLNAIGSPLPPNQIGGESFIRHIGNDKLIFDFKSSSGTTVKDRSREGNDGTFGAGAAAPTWKRNSLYFDGGNYVDLTGISHGIGTGEFTFCFHLDTFADNLNGEAAAVVFVQQTARIYIYKLKTDGKLSISSGATKVLSAASLTNIKPFILQITRDGSNNVEAYIGGSAEGQGKTFPTDIIYDGISIMRLGSRQDDLRHIIGTLYSFRILNKGLSGIEAQQIYLSQKFAGNN